MNDLPGGATESVGAGVALDSAGNPVVVTVYGLSGGHTLMRTIKYAAATGSVLWARDDAPGSGNDSYGLAVAVDGSDNVYVSGNFNSGAAYRVAKYDSAGTLQWAFNDANGSWGSGIAIDTAGNIVVAGADISESMGYTAAYKPDGSGSTVWTKTDANFGWINGVALDASNNVYVAGQDSTYSKGYLAKYPAGGGAALWTKTDTTGSAENFMGVAVDSAGQPCVVGDYNSVFPPNQSILYAFKYKADGSAYVWHQTDTSGGTNGNYGYGVAVDGQDNVVVTAAKGVGGSLQDMETVSFAASNGATVWPALNNSSSGHHGVGGQGVKVSSQGNVVVTGEMSNGATGVAQTISYPCP